MSQQSTATPAQIKHWRKRLKLFELRKKLLLEIMAKAGFGNAEAVKWLSTPLPELDGRTPKQLLKPYGMKTLLETAKRLLTPTAKL